MPTNKKGTRGERQLANLFDEQEPQFAVTREPASGSATERKLPDLHVARRVVVDMESAMGLAAWTETPRQEYAIEAKVSSGNPIYLSKEEIEGLVWYAFQFDATALIGVKFDILHGDPDYGEDSSGWYFMEPDECHRTPEGNYRVKKETAHVEGIPFEELVGTNYE